MRNYVTLTTTWALFAIVATKAKPAPPSFSVPASDAIDHVDPLIGNGGDSPNGSGGMIPSTAPPFAMTRWVAQTRQNYVSCTPYNHTDTTIHGFQGTHQPAIWMGESGQVILVPGTGSPKSKFVERGLSFDHKNEVITPSYYSVELEQGITVEQSATSRVGHFRFNFTDRTKQPYILVEASRQSVVGSAVDQTLSYPVGAIYPKNFTFPFGSIKIDAENRTVTGKNKERQDFIIGPNAAPSFAGYFCAKFSEKITGYGTASNWNGSIFYDHTEMSGEAVSAFLNFTAPGDEREIIVIDVRVGTSFISEEQACRNLKNEIPDGTTLEETAQKTREAWTEKLDRIQIEGGTEEQKRIFYTGVFHTLQYPYEQSEDGKYYSGYDDKIHDGESYTGYSIWDTYRAAWAWQILLAPERISPMVNSMLQDYKEGGWLPMWKNIVETNIMIGTHADSLIAEAILKGFTDFDVNLAYDAVRKDATVPPESDWTISYYDREEGVGYEVRAGLSSVYNTSGWVANDVHSEAASRTLDYAYDDHAVALLAAHLGRTQDAKAFSLRSYRSSFVLYNNETGFMEAKNANGTWAGQEEGWTEGDMWAYTFDVVQDVQSLIYKKGGHKKFVEFLDEHFDGGHNDHTNEPSHHIPYLYALSGAASKSQERIRQIAQVDYNDTADGLAGNEDCGQMSAWYLFSALGFYPVDPVSQEYVVGTPFFDKVTINLPAASKPLVISSPGASTKPYIKSLNVNGKCTSKPIFKHSDIKDGGLIEFEMSDKPEKWASSTLTAGEDVDVLYDQPDCELGHDGVELDSDSSDATRLGHDEL
ncbi:glycoside hydrolase family 92 protein [Abortiporus biennis]|nr:glycoside hydrolase family 92 protein [Abortiporus biennis]